MSEMKCFCHLNGYEVKDATARQQISDLEDRVNDLEENDGSGGGGGGALYQHDITIYHATYNGITGYDGPGCELNLRVYNRNPNKMLSFDEIKPHIRYFVSAGVRASDVTEECIFMGAVMSGGVLSVKVANAATDGLQHISTQTFNFNWNALSVADKVTEV